MNFFPESHIFPSPEPPRERRRIYPLFLPFSGCAARCVFCAQHAQTGTASRDVLTALERAGRDLRERERENRPALDLAFFGGTFTALPTGDFRACLDFAVRWQERGLIRQVRCSTRPDAVDVSILASLKAAGFFLLELGVQSFDDAALAESRRGYTAADARRACALVRDSGLKLGIQLMPGLPGARPETALRDVEESAALAPACARLYPCVVLEGTPLARTWRQGGYVPWSLKQALDVLGPACLALWHAGVPVIRMGLAREAGLEENVLAGPYHPDLGGMAKGRALYLYLRERMLAVSRGKASSAGIIPHAPGSAPTLRDDSSHAPVLHVPRIWQGAFWGHRGSLEPLYAALGLRRENILWWDKDYFVLTSAPWRNGRFEAEPRNPPASL